VRGCKITYSKVGTHVTSVAYYDDGRFARTSV